MGNQTRLSSDHFLITKDILLHLRNTRSISYFFIRSKVL